MSEICATFNEFEEEHRLAVSELEALNFNLSQQKPLEPLPAVEEVCSIVLSSGVAFKVSFETQEIVELTKCQFNIQ
jgi:hypothetical protein